MEFRPCIDIHNGKVKQIVGGSLKDTGDYAEENFVSSKDGAYYAGLYRELGLKGGHVIMLNSRDSEYYEATKQQALSALAAYPGGLQVGGGITADNAQEFIAAGASHVIVTSYVFKDGQIVYDNLRRISDIVSREHLVLDMSCRRQGDRYMVVTDRWQRFTSQECNLQLLDELAEYCDEFLIHAVDVEGKASGIETELVKTLSSFDKRPITYAGGIGSYDTLLQLKDMGNNRINATIGSALDLFGGPLSTERIIDICIQ